MAHTVVEAPSKKVLPNVAARWHDVGMKSPSRRDSAIAILLTSIVAIVVVFWVLSYWYGFMIGWERLRDHPREQTFWGLYVQRGQVGMGRSTIDADSSQLLSARLAHRESQDEHKFVLRAHGTQAPLWVSWGRTTTPDTIPGRLGFETVHSTKQWPGVTLSDRAVLVPWWSVFLVSLVITLRWTFFRERRLLWRNRNRCLACGYDLRHSPDRCPECGQAIGVNVQLRSVPRDAQ
jgi:hypothetical protein